MAFENLRQLRKNKAKACQVDKNSSCRDFQYTVTFLFEQIERKFWHTSENVDLSYIYVEYIKKIKKKMAKKDVTVVKKNFFNKKFGNDVIMAPI